jgi:hypothetical protein
MVRFFHHLVRRLLKEDFYLEFPCEDSTGMSQCVLDNGCSDNNQLSDVMICKVLNTRNLEIFSHIISESLVSICAVATGIRI